MDSQWMDEHRRIFSELSRLMTSVEEKVDRFLQQQLTNQPNPLAPSLSTADSITTIQPTGYPSCFTSVHFDLLSRFSPTPTPIVPAPLAFPQLSLDEPNLPLDRKTKKITTSNPVSAFPTSTSVSTPTLNPPSNHPSPITNPLKLLVNPSLPMVSSSISTPIRLPATNPLPQSPVPRTQPQPQPQALIKTYTQPWISPFQHSPTTRFYLPGNDPPPAKELSIVEKLLPLQLAMDHTSVASKTSVTSTSTLMETKSPGIVKSRRRAEMYGTEPSRCKRRQLFLLVYASTNDDLPNTEPWVGLKPPLLLPEQLRLGHVALLVLDQADDSDVVLIHRRINCKDLRDGIFCSDNAKWKEQRPCRIVRSISKGFRISMDERDQLMDAVFLDELCSGIAYKSNRPKVVMSLENCATMKGGRAEDNGVLVMTSLGLQVDLEALRMEKLEAAKKKTMNIERFLSNSVRHRTSKRNRPCDLLDPIVTLFPQEKSVLGVTFFCCPLQSTIVLNTPTIISFGLRDWREKWKVKMRDWREKWKVKKALKSKRLMRNKECQCSDPTPRCLLPLPQGYKIPVTWLMSRDMIWCDNVPPPKLVEYKEQDQDPWGLGIAKL